MNDEKPKRRQRTLESSVAVVAAPWAESSYYADAERWTWLFWDQNSVFRRLFNRLDRSAIIELACGHGRHAERIADLCGHLTLIDVFDTNLTKCADRLKGCPNVSFQKGNGYDFAAVPSNSVTAIYCYDAMVHFSPDIVASYLADAARILKDGGMALLHHSNHVSPPTTVHYGQNPHARNHMTRDLFREYAEQAGLSVVESVVIDWAGVPQLDCVSLVRKEPSEVSAASSPKPENTM
jgi:SAM-dependent methyltransferase